MSGSPTRRTRRPAFRSARRLGVAVAAVLVAAAAFPVAGLADPPTGPAPGLEVSAAVRHDVSPPLAHVRPTAPSAANLRERPLKSTGPGSSPNQIDPVEQPAPVAQVATSAGLDFAGIGAGDYGFTDQWAPPDTNGAVGATQYVQWVNTDFAVFDKSSGQLLLGPEPGNTVWSGFGGGCETNNDGDPIVQYDKAANRWILTQFSISSTPYLQCVAISTTSDATGSYYRYAFSYGSSQFPDYPKLGVWPDAYYITFNMFTNTFVGPKACAYDRAAMLVGAAATQQCFQLGSSYGAMLPGDLDGATPPPAGEPESLLSLASNSLDFWRFHVDWTNSANTTLTGPVNIPVASFSEACNGGTCIPQPGTNQKLDSLGDRLMYRLAYRNLGDHESLVVDHSVKVGGGFFRSGTSSVRWYEIRNATGHDLGSGTPVLYQQGTLNTSDGIHRWMGSIAMDQNGDIALGYSASSSSVYPSIRYTGRTPSDPLGTMEAETVIQAGSGSQLQNLSRWGDYSAMSVDPVDDCTFWYTNEYLKTNGTWNWSTRIASFSFPGCNGTAPAPDFTISASPTSLSIDQGASASSTISTGVIGTAGLVDLSAAVSPANSGVTATLSPTSVTAGGSSTLTVDVGSTAATGSYTVTVTGTEGSNVVHTVDVAVDVTSPPAPDFTISASPTSLSIDQGASASSTISTGVIGTAGLVDLSAAVSPANSGVTATLSPTSVTAGGSSTLTVDVGSTAATGSYTVTVTGTEGSNVVHTVDVAVDVTSPAGTVTAPDAPQDLVASVAHGKGVTLTWSPPTSDGGSAIVGYNVYRSDTGSSFSDATVIASPGNVLKYRDTSTTKQTDYYYWVTASNSVGEGPPSNDAPATPKK